MRLRSAPLAMQWPWPRCVEMMRSVPARADWQPRAGGSVARREIDEIGDRLSLGKAADRVTDDRGGGRRMRLGRDMRSHDDARMAPERMPFRERLLAKDIEHRPRQLAAVEHRDQVGLNEVAAPPGIDEGGPARQAREEASVQDALGRSG